MRMSLGLLLTALLGVAGFIFMIIGVPVILITFYLGFVSWLKAVGVVGLSLITLALLSLGWRTETSEG